MDNRQVLIMDENYQIDLDDITQYAEEIIKVSIRPEEFTISDTSEGMAGVIQHNVFLGINVHYTVQLSNGENVEVTEESTLGEPLEPGTEVKLLVNKEKINLFHYESEKNILEGDSYAK